MLDDINSPKSRAILAAAQHLDALQRAWQLPHAAPAHEIDTHIESLRTLARTHFTQSRKIGGWINELSALLKSDSALRMNSQKTFYELISKLDSSEGFQTVFI